MSQRPQTPLPAANHVLSRSDAVHFRWCDGDQRFLSTFEFTSADLRPNPECALRFSYTFEISCELILIHCFNAPHCSRENEEFRNAPLLPSMPRSVFHLRSFARTQGFTRFRLVPLHLSGSSTKIFVVAP